jgi:poly [ADP-ribose] polymerase
MLCYVKVSGLSAVHEDSKLQDSGVVLQEHGKVYCETMGLADVASGVNSYYVLQLIHETARNRFHVFRKWGRVGTTIGGKKLEAFPKDEAIDEFERLFLDKTGFEFCERDAMREDPTKFKRAGKFLPVAIDYGADEDLGISAGAGAGSTLAKETQQLVRMISDVKLSATTRIERGTFPSSTRHCPRVRRHLSR